MLSYLRAPLAAMRSQQVLFDTLAHNLSNLNTTGFRRLNAEFADVVYRQLQSVQGQPDTARNMSAGVLPEAISRSFAMGQFEVTGNPMDIALNGTGFLQAQLADGRIAYTRDGTLAVDGNGRLTTASGHPLLPEVQVPADASRFYIYPNGAVYVQRGLEDRLDTWEQIGQVQVAIFANPQGLLAEGANMFVPGEAAGAPIVGLPSEEVPGQPGELFGEVLFATLESSNVNPGVETTTMMMAQRAYGVSVRSLQALDQMLDGAVNLGRG